MIQKNYCLKRDAPIDFLGLNENNDHIWLEINKSALTKNLPCDTTQTISNLWQQELVYHLTFSWVTIATKW